MSEIIKKVSTSNLSAYIYSNGHIKLLIYNFRTLSSGWTDRTFVCSCFGVPSEKFTFEYVEFEIKRFFKNFPKEEINELLNKLI